MTIFPQARVCDKVRGTAHRSESGYVQWTVAEGPDGISGPVQFTVARPGQLEINLTCAVMTTVTDL